MFFLSSHFLQHGRSDSYRVATIPKIRDDNKTADGMYKVFTAWLPVRGGSPFVLRWQFFSGLASSTTDPPFSVFVFLSQSLSSLSSLSASHVNFLHKENSPFSSFFSGFSLSLSLSVSLSLGSQLTIFPHRHFTLTIVFFRRIFFENRALSYLSALSVFPNERETPLSSILSTLLFGGSLISLLWWLELILCLSQCAATCESFRDRFFHFVFVCCWNLN